MRKTFLVALAVGLGSVGAVAFAAPAEAAFSGHFQCDVTMSPWPAPGNSFHQCGGEIRGAGTNMIGQTETCLPCSFSMEFQILDTVCVGPLFPLDGQINALLVIDNTNFSEPFVAKPIGPFLWIFAPPVSGWASIRPSTPIPTCAAPGPLHATITGDIAWP